MKAKITMRFSFVLFVGLFLTACSVTRPYRQEAERKWERDILKFEELDKQKNDPKDAILFVGSSSIRLWSTLAEDVAPYPVIQRGFGGSRYSDLAVYIKRIVYPHQFRAIVIFVANDVTGGSEDKTPQEVGRLVNYIGKTIRAKYSQPIFFVAVTPTKSRWKVWPTIQLVNQEMAKVCSKLPDTHLIETASFYLNAQNEPRTELFLADKLHMNHDGYRIWGNLIKKELDKVLNGHSN